MQKKYIIRIALVLILVAGSVIILSSATGANKASTCSESMEECSNKKNSNSPSGEMIWENISRQFISSVQIGR